MGAFCINGFVTEVLSEKSNIANNKYEKKKNSYLLCAVLCCAVLCCAVLSYTILYYTILYYTILYYTILYYTILYYTILYYTILSGRSTLIFWIVL